MNLWMVGVVMLPGTPPGKVAGTHLLTGFPRSL